LSKFKNEYLKYTAISTIIVVSVLAAFFLGRYLDALYFGQKNILSVVFSMLVVLGLLYKLVIDLK